MAGAHHQASSRDKAVRDRDDNNAWVTNVPEQICCPLRKSLPAGCSPCSEALAPPPPCLYRLPDPRLCARLCFQPGAQASGEEWGHACVQQE